MTLLGAFVAASVANVVIFTLGGEFFGCGPMVLATSWTMPLLFAAVACALTEAAKRAARAHPDGSFSKNWQW